MTHVTSDSYFRYLARFPVQPQDVSMKQWIVTLYWKDGREESGEVQAASALKAAAELYRISGYEPGAWANLSNWEAKELPCKQ